MTELHHVSEASQLAHQFAYQEMLGHKDNKKAWKRFLYHLDCQLAKHFR